MAVLMVRWFFFFRTGGKGSKYVYVKKKDVIFTCSFCYTLAICVITFFFIIYIIMCSHSDCVTATHAEYEKNLHENTCCTLLNTFWYTWYNTHSFFNNPHVFEKTRCSWYSGPDRKLTQNGQRCREYFLLLFCGRNWATQISKTFFFGSNVTISKKKKGVFRSILTNCFCSSYPAANLWIRSKHHPFTWKTIDFRSAWLNFVNFKKIDRKSYFKEYYRDWRRFWFRGNHFFNDHFHSKQF